MSYGLGDGYAKRGIAVEHGDADLAPEICRSKSRAISEWPMTDNGTQFAERPRNRNSFTYRKIRFDLICEANGIEHCLTKPNHPWTNGQVERMKRAIINATVKRHHYDNHDQLRGHLSDAPDAYNYTRRLKTLHDLTPYEYICKIWTNEPDGFILNPIQQMPRPNN